MHQAPRKYGCLRLIGYAILVMAWILLIAGVAGVITSWLAGTQMFRGVQLTIVQIGSVLSLLVSLALFFQWFVLGSLLVLATDLERNTRRSAHAIERLADLAEAPMAAAPALAVAAAPAAMRPEPPLPPPPVAPPVAPPAAPPVTPTIETKPVVAAAAVAAAAEGPLPPPPPLAPPLPEDLKAAVSSAPATVEAKSGEAAATVSEAVEEVTTAADEAVATVTEPPAPAS